MEDAIEKSKQRSVWQIARAAVHNYERAPTAENAKAVEAACEGLRHRDDALARRALSVMRRKSTGPGGLVQPDTENT